MNNYMGGVTVNSAGYMKRPFRNLRSYFNRHKINVTVLF